MVNLMLQPVFMNLVKGSTDHKMTSDDLYNMWSVASRAKSAIVQGRRLENLSWRLWYTSTIRAKIEMEEKQKMKKINRANRFAAGDDLDESNCGELSSTDQYAHNNNVDSSSEENSRDSYKSEKSSENKNSLVLPSDRPLFTSTCTSILAEIQDASFRFGQSGGNGTGMVGLHNFTNIHNYNNFSNHSHSHGHSNSHIHGHVNNILSPPIPRSKSPANNLNNNNSNQPKRKKNVEKFLKKFKSNLEDITEQFDEKLGFTDEETNHEDSTAETQQMSQVYQEQTHHTEESLSPTNTINNFATDEEGPDSSFYAGEPEFISIEKSSTSKKSQISMISRLLKKDESAKYSSLEDIIKVNPDPIHQIPEPKFLYATCNTNNTNNRDNFINNQLELMAANRYNRFISTSMSIKSPKPTMMGGDTGTIDSVSINKRVIDANALSTSLSANKFKLEEEFDSQIVIW